MLNFFDKIHINLLNVLFPDFCFGCANLLIKNEKTICSKCLHLLPLTRHNQLKESELTRVLKGIIPIEYGFSMLYFNKKGITQNLIHNLKYKNKQNIGTYLGNLYALELQNHEVSKSVDYIIPVPLHKKRLHERGYNQVTTFCNAIGEQLNILVLNNVLIKKEYLKSQTIKNKENRLENNKNAFTIQNYENLNNKHFLLVDDVFTTGATLESCARELLKIENAKVSILTIAFSQS